MPRFAFFLVFCALASVGLPGLNGFVGEFLILVGSFRAGWVWATVAAAFGVVLAAVYLFKMLHETVWGPLRHDENRELPDLGAREIGLLAPLCLLMLAIGLAPRPFLEPSRADLERVLGEYRTRVAEAAVAAPAIRGPLSAAAEEAP